MYANSGGVARVTSPDSALASDVFDKFCNAVTFKSILSLYRQLCDLLRLKPTYFPLFYPKLKAKLRSWKAQALWSKFDKRASHRCYNRGRPCSNTRVLIIGGGPCGLRTAIEAQLLGAKVVVVEKRDRFSRNNVLHLWPFVIHDLRALGAKKFFGKFCAGSIDHISIRQLQCILLKVALLLGVEIHENVTFDGLVEPPEDQSIKIGWKAKISPADHPVSQYEFDVLIGADGKRNTLDGFKRKEFRGRLAIAITANLVNKKSEAEARVEEISGVAFIFNQKFFKELNAVTGIDLENIVYYKDETHYFVMTAKKQSLLNKGVIIKDYPDTVKLLSIENVNKEALMEYARQAADFSTNYQLPHLDFAVNHYGQPDVAMFDFTSMFAAENASRVLERRGHKMLMCLVGDSLLEPFWPTGSGCARGWLSSFDACWAMHSWSSGRMTPLEVLAERESIYRLLAQTTPENLNKDYSAYTVEPQTRYPNLNTRACLDFQVRCFYDTDNPAELERPVKAPVEEGARKRTKRPDSFIHPDTLLLWLKKQIALYDITITDVTTSFQDGLALCAIIHRYRPDLLDFASLDPANVAVNNQLAFDILEELGLPPVTTGYEMAQLAVPDKLAMLSYLTQVHELFRGEIPCVKQPKRELTESEEDILGATSQKRPVTLCSAGQYQRAAAQNKTSSRLSTTNKRKTLERVVTADASSTLNRTGGDRNKADMSLRKARKRRSTDRSLHGTIDRSGKPGARGGGASEGSESLSNKVRDLEAKLRGNRPTDKKPKDLIRAIGKLDKNDWQLSALEKKIEENQTPGGLKDPHDNKVPKWNRDAFTDKFEAINRRIHGLPVEAINEKHSNLERNMKQLDRKLKEGSVLDTGHRGSNKVSAMAQQLSKKVPEVSSMNDQAESFRPKPVLNLPQQGGSETCHFCGKRVYLMERMSAEGRFFHRGCFRCEYCATTLRLGGYAFVRDDLLGGVFFCMPHVSMLYYMRNKLLLGRNGENCVDGQMERTIAQPVAAQPTSQHLTADKPIAFEPLKSPLVQAAVQATDVDFRRDGTPERVEFENSIADEAAKDEQLSEIDEDEWTDHNFGNSIHSGTEDEASSLDDSSSDEDEDEEGAENLMELDRPLTADETRRLAETWKKRHLAEATDRTQHEYRESPHESIPENEEENNVRIDVPAFPLPSEPCYKKSSEEATSSGTEMGSEDEPELEDEEDEEEYEEESEYESGEEEEEDDDDEDDEDDEDEDEEDARDSATEIETDSEFDQNSNADVRLGPQGIPTIIVNESEAEQLKKSTDQLANGNGMDNDHVSDVEAEVLIPTQPTQSNGNPKPSYVEQYISLENARPLQRTLSHDDSRKIADPPTTPGRSGVLAYLRRHEELERSPSATDMMASKNSLELKKKYLDYGGSTGSLVQKSASAADLDSRLRSVTDTISEAQKKLNPAPQPSVPMQVFLQNTANIFHPRPHQLPSVLPVKNDEPIQPVLSIEKEISPKDDSEEPETPTNCEPAAEAIAVDSTEIMPVISSDSGSSQTNENIVDEVSSSESDSEKPKAESNNDASSGFDTDSEPDSSEAPYEALNQYVALPSVVVEENEEPAVLVLQNEPAVPLSQSDGESPVQPPHPQLAMQENFDLSPSSEKADVPEKRLAVVTRTLSKESVDSSKFALSEAEFSDWADSSLRGDLDAELNMNPAGAKQMAPKEPPKIKSSTETPSAKPDITLDNGPSNFDDIEYADNSEEQAVDLNGYTPLVEELPTPDKPDTPVAVESPEVPNFAFSRLRDSIAMSRDRQSPLFTPIKDERVHKEIHRRMLEKKKYESSPNLLRKKEAISQERERQGDLVREMVFSRIQRTSPEKTRERRGSYGSMTPPGSSRASRSDSEPRSTISPDRRDIFATPHSSLRSVAEIPPPLSNEYMTPMSSNKKDAEMSNENALGAVKRELFTSTPSIRPTDNEFKTPNLKEWQDANRQLDRQNSARLEARAKAQAKADQDLGLSPPDYIENLKDKLRRKPRVDDDSNEVLPVRTRSFSEPNVDAEKSWDLPSRPNAPAQIPSEVAGIPPAKPPRLMATPSNITPAQKVEQSRISDNASSVPAFNNSVLKNAKSMSHIVTPTIQPPSPRTDVIGNMFVQQHNRPSSSSPTSPPQSPRSVDSSKSTSYLWAGLSPAESQAKLDADSAASASTPSTTNEHGVKVKKSKDRERRRSIIQTITGLFSSSKKEDAKESDSPSKKSSPTKFQLPKFSGKKDKSSKDKLAVDNSYEEGRLRSASSPVTPPNEDGKGGVKPRAASLLASPTSGSEATTPTSGFAVDQCDSSGTPSGQWSTFSSSTKRQSKQARQVARQTELKRLRMAQSIQRQLEEMEVKQKELEEQGVRLERTLRGEEGGVSGRDESALMQEWFQLVHEKNALSRYEQELMVRARELELEDRHARLHMELKDRMSLDETAKSPADVDKEGAILSEMLEIVEQKDSLRSMLEEDRQRWAVFLNLIDLAQSSLEDDVFGPDSAEKQENEDESYGAFQAYSDQIPASEVPGCELWDTGEGQPDTVDSDLEIEEEFEHLFCDDHSNTPPRIDSINDFLESDLVVLDPVENSIHPKTQHPAKIAWSPSVEFEGQIVELKDLVSQEELELWSAAAPSDNDVVNEQDVLEFDQLVQDLSDDCTASLDSSLEEKHPNDVEFESQPIEMIDLNSQGETEFWSGNDESMANSDAERAVSSVGTDYEYFYEQRQTASQIKQKKTSQILREKVEVFDELDRKARKRVEAVEDENDRGTLGVKFENRGVVRDLVWMWEYNHLQQSGRRGVYPEMNDRPKRKEKKDDRSTGRNDLDSNMQQGEQPKKTRKKRKKIKPNMELEREKCPSDPDGGWARWQIGILFWLTVFSFFILSTLPADIWPSFY